MDVLVDVAVKVVLIVVAVDVAVIVLVLVAVVVVVMVVSVVVSKLGKAMVVVDVSAGKKIGNMSCSCRECRIEAAANPECKRCSLASAR